MLADMNTMDNRKLMFEHSFFEERIPINESLRLWGEGLQIFLNYLLWQAVVNYRVSSQRVCFCHFGTRRRRVRII